MIADRKISAIAPVHGEKSVDRRKDMSKITLKEVPYEIGDDTALNYCSVGADRNFEIVADDTYVIGHVYLSEDTETSTGIPCDTYVDWAEILTAFRNRHLLRPMLKAIYDMFGEFYFESAEESNAKFKHISECISCGISDITELEIFRYVEEEGDGRIKET